MAEIGVIASIIGIAGVGIKLSKTLFEIGEKAVSVDKNLHRLATNVALFAQTLKHFAEVMRTNEHLYSYEFEETAGQIIAECESIFSDLTRRAVMARAAGDTGQSNEKKKITLLVQRVRSFFEQSKVDWLLAQLEYLKTTLSVLIQTLQLAAVTAQAKQNSITEQQQRHNEAVDREKVHIETLIIARQLSFLVVLQQNYQQAEAQKASGTVAELDEESASVSPVESDDDVGTYEQKLLTEGPSESSSLVHLGRSHLKFLDDAIDREEPAAFPALSPSHTQIIDQLLGRWTTLPELEREINENKAMIQAAQSSDTTRNLASESKKDREMEMALPEYDVENEAAHPNVDLKIPSATEFIPIDTSASAEIVAFPVTGTQTDKNLSPGPNNARMTARTPPPPLTTHTTDPILLSSMSKASLDGPPLGRTVSTPEPDIYSPRQPKAALPPGSHLNSMAPFSPSSQPVNPAPTSVPTDRNFNQSSKARRISFTSATSNSRPGSSHQPVSRNLYPSPTSPRNSIYGSSPDSDVDDDGRGRLGLGIPWRIVIGPKYWDFLDERLVGPRTPYLPTEPLSYLYSHDYAETEVAEKWVCEEAIAERNLKYIHFPADEQSDARWRIKIPLKFGEVDSLVERTIDIFRRKRTTTQQPPSSLPSSSLPSSRDGPIRGQPIPTSAPQGQSYYNNGPMQMPPPPPLPMDPAARARADNFNTWQQMNNSQQARAQQQQQQQLPPRSYPMQEPAWMPQPAPQQRNVHFTPSTISAAPSSSAAGPSGTNPGGYGWQGYGYPSYQAAGSRGTEQEARHERHDNDAEHSSRHKRRSRDKKKKSSTKSLATAAKVSGLMAVLDSLDAF